MQHKNRAYPWQRRRRQFVLFLFTVCAAAAGLFAFVSWRGENALEREIASIRAKGFPATSADLAASYPAALDGRDGAADYRKSLNAIRDAARKGRQGDVTAELNKTPKQALMASALLDGMKAYLEENRDLLRLLHEAANRPPGRYPLDFAKGIQVSLPHLAPLRDAVRLLRIEALAAAAEGDTARAVDAVRAALAAADSVRQEPTMISQLVRVACHETTVDAVNRMLNLCAFSESELAQLHDFLRDSEEPDALTRALAGERALVLTSFEHPEQFLENIPAIHGFGEGAVSAVAGLIRVTGAINGERARYLSFMDEVIAASQHPLYQALPGMREISDRLQAEPSALPSLTDAVVPGLVQMTEAFARDASMIAAAQTATAIERYRIAHEGAVPGQLNQLVPEFLATVPLDPFSGQPMQYQAADDEYILNGGYQNAGRDQSAYGQWGQRGDPADLVFWVNRAAPAEKRLVAAEDTVIRSG